MIVVDVNLMLHATVSGFPQHEQARAWWEQALNAAEDVGLCSAAVFGFLRIVTNPRVLISPVPVDAATRYVSEWLNRPNVRFLVPGPRHLDIAFEPVHGVGTVGNLTTDIQLQHSRWKTTRRCSLRQRLGKFPGLRWSNPLS